MVSSSTSSPKKQYKAMSEDDRKQKEWLAKLWVGLTIRNAPMARTDFVVFNPEDEEMDGETNKVKALPDHVLKFIDDFPAVVIKSEEVKLVDVKNFDAAVEKQQVVDKSDSWEDVLKGLVKHVGTKSVDVACGAANKLMNRLL